MKIFDRNVVVTLAGIEAKKFKYEHPDVAEIKVRGGKQLNGTRRWGIRLGESHCWQARRETLLEKPTWSELMQKGQRGLLQIKAFEGIGPHDDPNPKKIYELRRSNGGCFAMAVLYTDVGFVYVTEKAGAALRPFHGRPAVFLTDPADQRRWLEDGTLPPEERAVDIVGVWHGTG